MLIYNVYLLLMLFNVAEIHGVAVYYDDRINHTPLILVM